MALDYTALIVSICIGLAVYWIYHFYRKTRNETILNDSGNRMDFDNGVEYGTKHIGDRRIGKISFFISGIPLLVYPFVLAASLMGLAGYRDGSVRGFIESMADLFYILTIIYPIVYIICRWIYSRKGSRQLVVIPFIHILVCAVLFIILTKVG